MEIILEPRKIQGLPEKEQEQLRELLEVYHRHRTKNKIKNDYYEGDIKLEKVNLGIALPKNLQKLEIGCSWGEKTVDVLANRSMFDGFVGVDGNSIEQLDRLVMDNQLLTEYPKLCRDELKLGCTFATLSSDPNIGCKIRFHSAESAAALWDGSKGRIDCGFAIIDTVKDETQEGTWRPSWINLYTESAIWELVDTGRAWVAREHPNQLGRPMMEGFIWNATHKKPFGQSRLKHKIRNLIDGYVRTVANASLGLEFATSPQKYILGVTDEQYEALIDDKFKQYVGSIIAATPNPETGSNPVFGQLGQGSLAPHVEMLRILSTQFSAATGLTVTDTGVVNDANPTSSDAILAQSQTLVGLAEQLNAGNGEALKNVALMALAILNDTTIEGLSPEARDVVPHFKNPAMPSVAVTADAAIKIAASREGFANTDVFLEMIGFSKADIRRIKAEEVRARGVGVLQEVAEE